MLLLFCNLTFFMQRHLVAGLQPWEVLLSPTVQGTPEAWPSSREPRGQLQPVGPAATTPLASDEEGHLGNRRASTVPA